MISLLTIEEFLNNILIKHGYHICIMHVSESNVEHNLKIMNRIINEMTQRFHKYKKQTDQSWWVSEKDNEHLGMMAGKIGYLVNISVGAAKTWNYEERIIKLEKDSNDPIPAQVRKEYQFNPDIMLTVVRDGKGKLMN